LAASLPRARSKRSCLAAFFAGFNPFFETIFLRFFSMSAGLCFYIFQSRMDNCASNMDALFREPLCFVNIYFAEFILPNSSTNCGIIVCGAGHDRGPRSIALHTSGDQITAIRCIKPCTKIGNKSVLVEIWNLVVRQHFGHLIKKPLCYDSFPFLRQCGLHRWEIEHDVRVQVLIR